MLHPTTEADQITGDPFSLPYVLAVRPSAEFAYEAAKNKLYNLRIGAPDGPQVTFVVPGDVIAGDEDGFGGDEDYPGRQGQLLRLSGWIDLDSHLTVGCAGAVLSYIQRRRASGYLPGDPAAHAMFRVSTMQMFSLTGTMYVFSLLRFDSR